MKRLIIYFGLCMLLAAYSGANSADLTLLDGNDFVLKVDKISEHPNVQFPHSNLKESDYKETKEGAHYEIIISQDGQTETIGSGPIQGQKTDDGMEPKNMNLMRVPLRATGLWYGKIKTINWKLSLRYTAPGSRYLKANAAFWFRNNKTVKQNSLDSLI